MSRAKAHISVETTVTFPIVNKKLSYRRETARQLPTWREGRARSSSSPPSAPSGRPHAGLKTSQQETPLNIYKWFTLPETRVIGLHMVESESHNVRTSSVPSVKRTLR